MRSLIFFLLQVLSISEVSLAQVYIPSDAMLGRAFSGSSISKAQAARDKRELNKANEALYGKASKKLALIKNEADARRLLKRVWVDVTGKFEVEAMLVGWWDDKITLEKDNKSKIKVSLGNLSGKDKDFVEEWRLLTGEERKDLLKSRLQDLEPSDLDKNYILSWKVRNKLESEKLKVEENKKNEVETSRIAGEMKDRETARGAADSYVNQMIRKGSLDQAVYIGEKSISRVNASVVGEAFPGLASSGVAVWYKISYVSRAGVKMERDDCVEVVFGPGIMKNNGNLMTVPKIWSVSSGFKSEG